MKKTIYTIVISLAIVILVYAAKQLLATRTAEVTSSKPPIMQTIRVNTTIPKKGTLTTMQRFLAQIYSEHDIKLATKLAGTIKKLYVHTGQNVHQGDLLVDIDSQELQANINTLDATLNAQINDLNQAIATDNANSKLYEAGALPKQKLDQFRVSLSAKKAQVVATKQKIAQAKHQMTYLKLTAPFDGHIDSIMLHEGDLVTAGRPIIAISDGKKKLVFGFVPTAKTKIKPGQPVYLNNKQIGAVNTIYATSKNGLVNAEITLDSDIGFPVGASIDIDIAIDVAQGCVLPDDTLIHTARGVRLMQYDEKHFAPLDVNITAQNEGYVIVKPCPTYPVARGSEMRLIQLPAYDNILISGARYETN